MPMVRIRDDETGEQFWLDEEAGNIYPISQKMLDRADPTSGMSIGDKFLAGMGQSVASTARGISGLLGDVGGGTLGLDIPTHEQAQTMDQQLLDTGAGMAGNIAGHGLQMAALPGSTALRAGGTAAGYTALQPDTDLTDVGMAAGGGFIGQKIGQIATRKIRDAANPATRAMIASGRKKIVNAAEKLGFRVSPGMRTGDKAAVRLEAAWASDPATAGIVDDLVSHNERTLNRIASKAMGLDPVDDISDDVLNAAEDAISAKYRDVLDSLGTIQLSNMSGGQSAARRIKDAADRYVSIAGLPDKATVRRLAKDIAGKSSLTPDEFMEWHKAWRNVIHKAYKAGDHNQAKVFERAIDALEDAVGDQIDPGVMPAYKAARQAARSKIMVDAATNKKTGMVSADKLSTAMDKGNFRQGIRKGTVNQDMIDLYDGARFVQTMPDSWTATRQATQQGVRDKATKVGLGAAGSLLTGDPTLAGIGIAAAVAPDVANRARAAMSMGPAAIAGQRAMSSLPALPPVASPILNQTMAPLIPMLGRPAGAIAAAPALLGQPQ